MTPEQLSHTLNIGLDQEKQILRVTTQCGIHKEVHPISRNYRTYNLDICRKYISGRWYVDWMPVATKSITQFKCVFVYPNGTFPEFYRKKATRVYNQWRRFKNATRM